MKAIAAVDENMALGYKGQLLFRIKSDLKHFKNETLGGTVIMGRKTLESMPGGRPLPGRNTLVLSKSMQPGIFSIGQGGEHWIYAVFNDPEKLLAFVDWKNPASNVCVCGGEQIYRLLLDKCDELVITEVRAKAEQADAFFPDFKSSGEFEAIEDSGEMEEEGLKYNIVRYRRKNG